ncbi:hypothetical protein [Parahaliea aestuarii]|uniref:Uncharacterized protein n=1 Tax=Parahaliea aestuarii TaxID=1852021 RepID=A0A5C8ZVN0_9GAMM|nr:hypothetical protein [Parahaliea aestuarii]TXS92548.1 hypothetical protein FVW59_09035 [Parahaliea aestuarii]
MFIKTLSLLFSILVTVTYVIGFIYDASFLEEFGVNYYEMMGSPLDYLSIGGMLLLLSYSKNITWLVFVLGIIGICYVPLKRRIPKSTLNKFIDIESLPFVVFSTIPIAFLLLIPVIPDAKKAAKEVIAAPADIICIEDEDRCFDGVVLRYRDSKIIFYNSELKETKVYTDRKLLSAKHS